MLARAGRPASQPTVTLVLATLLILLASSTAGAQDESDLARARAQITDIEAELQAANQASEDARDDLARAREALDRIETIVNAVAQRVEEQEDVVREAEDELDRIRADEESARRSIRLKAVEEYKRAGGGEFKTLVGAQDIQAAIDRSALLWLVGQRDTARVEDLDATRRRRTAAVEVLDRESAALDDLLAEQEAVMAEAERARESRALAVAAAEDDVAELEAEHDHLTDLEAEIERAIAEREAAERAAREAAAREAAAREAAAAEAAAADTAADTTADASGDDGGDEGGSGDPPAPPPTTGGGYAWPLCGIVTSEFGWRWGRQHEGIDIDDNRTDRITAAQAGTVIFAGYNSGGYGNLVLMQHADGVVTAYAHQRAIAVGVGQSVSQGQLVGYVGNTGNSTGPHLHFETRVGGGSPVNPRQLLSGSGC